MKIIRPLQPSVGRLCCLISIMVAQALSTSAAVVNVSVANNRFSPSSVTVNVNDQVTWNWEAADGPVPHTTTSDTGLWDSGIQTQPFSFTHTFSSAGSFPYHCTLHAAIGMRGTVTVQPGSVSEPPVITAPPASQTVNSGADVVFTVVATGTPPLSYQWKKNGNTISGATDTSLTLHAVSTGDAGNYSVTVSSSAGSTTSGEAVLTVQSGSVNHSPVITMQPASQTASPGNDVVFTITTTGTPPLSYQWKKDGNPIAGATDASLTLHAVSTSDDGSYSVTVSNSAGSATSSGAILTVQTGSGNQPPVITTQPASQTVSPSVDVVFTVAAAGAPQLSYQWNKNGTAIPGATDASLTLRGVTTDDAGNYSVTVSSSTGSTDSAEAALTVQAGGGNTSVVAGTYTGLFFVPDAVAQSSSGTFTLKSTATGKFSGSLQIGRRRIHFSGQFDNTGAATKTISSKGATPLTLALQVDSDDPDKITGTVSDGQSTAQLLANRAVFNGRQQAASQAGVYTLSITGAEDSSVAPGGDSVATVRVDRTGKIRLAGSLADGTKITQTAVVSKNGDWPFYVALYGGQGSILGWFTFAQTDTADISGNVAWIKPSIPKARFYPAGFDLNTTSVGYHYTPPTAGNSILGLTDAVLTLSGGGLAQDLSQPVIIGPKNRVTGADGRKLRFSFSPSTGTFKGSIGNLGTQKPVSLNGVVLQSLNSGTGYFLGSGQSGKVTLSAP